MTKDKATEIVNSMDKDQLLILYKLLQNLGYMKGSDAPHGRTTLKY